MKKFNKPEKYTVECLDLLETLHYLEQLRPGIENRVWDYYEADIRNGGTFTAFLCISEEEFDDKDIYEDLLLIKNEFDIGDTIEFVISW